MIRPKRLIIFFALKIQMTAVALFTEMLQLIIKFVSQLEQSLIIL